MGLFGFATFRASIAINFWCCAYDSQVERFQDDDAGYERWLVAHPDLFVLNTARNPAPNYRRAARQGQPFPQHEAWAALSQALSGASRIGS